MAMPSGIGAATRMMSGWGLKFFDYDNDGNLDLFLANGNPDDLIESLHPGRDLSRAAHCSCTTPGMAFRMSASRAVRSLPRQFRLEAWRWATSTMMARWMF